MTPRRPADHRRRYRYGRADCPDCGRAIGLDSHGRLRKHGPADATCPGSWGRPDRDTTRKT